MVSHWPHKPGNVLNGSNPTSATTLQALSTVVHSSHYHRLGGIVGDRANVYIHENGRPGVYLYTHWDGTALPRIIKDALQTVRAQNRLTDSAYLARILFEEMVHDSLGSETGYGISADIQDGADRIVDIDTYNCIITLIGYPYDWDNVPIDPYAYEDLIDW